MLADVWRGDSKGGLWRKGEPIQVPLSVVLMKEVGSLYYNGGSRYREMDGFKCKFDGQIQQDWQQI